MQPRLAKAIHLTKKHAGIAPISGVVLLLKCIYFLLLAQLTAYPACTSQLSERKKKREWRQLPQQRSRN